jgi:hypothetical protein
VGVRSERLGFRDKSRRTDAPVEGKGTLDLRAPFLLASFGEQPGADMESEVRLVVHLPEFCEGVCCAQEIAFEQRSGRTLSRCVGHRPWS